MTCNWKKKASLSAALSNGEDETLVTLKGYDSYSGVEALKMTIETPKYIGDLLDRYDQGERDFRDCDFENHVNLQSLILDGSNLEGSLFFSADFTGTSFRDCNLTNCGFKCCKFENVDFENADLKGCLLSGAEFINCNFYNANLDGADWYGHSITTEDFINKIAK